MAVAVVCVSEMETTDRAHESSFSYDTQNTFPFAKLISKALTTEASTSFYGYRIATKAVAVSLIGFIVTCTYMLCYRR